MATASHFFYRVRQGLMRLTIRPRDVDDAAAAELLSPNALALFKTQSLGDQRHALNVLAELQAAGYGDEHLLQAALLHDVGKAQANITLAHRTAIILLGAISPHWLTALASEDPRSTRYAFHVHLRHDALGAEACQRAGLDGVVVWLVAQHQAKPLPKGPDDHLAMLAALQDADDRC